LFKAVIGKVMKILFVNDTFLVGRGVDTVIYELAKKMAKRHDITVLCSADFCNIKEGSLNIKKIWAGKLFTGGLTDFLLPIKLWKFRNAVKREDYDVVNVHHSTMFLGLVGLKNVVVTYHGSPPAYGLTKYPRKFVNVLGRISLRRARKIVTISKYLRDELMRFGVPKENIVVIPNCVSEDFKPTWKDNNYMLYVGRLEKHKRVEQLIRLAKEINFPLMVVGIGPEKQRLERLARKLESPTEFFGKVDRKKLIKLYQECSFFISASEWEGFGLIFLEANRCGKPVIGYDSAAVRERIKNNFNGFRVRTFEELVNKASLIKENNKLRSALGKKGLEYSKKFGWEKSCEKYERVFEKQF